MTDQSMGFIYLLLGIPYALVFLAYRISGKSFLPKIIAYITLFVLTIFLYMHDLIDLYSFIYSIPATYIALFISLYCDKYVYLNKYPKYTILLIDLFSLTMISAFLSPNILGLAIAWTVSEIIGFILIGLGETHSIEGSTTASREYLFVSSLTFELSIFTLIYILISLLTAIVGKSMGLDSLTNPFWGFGEKIAVPAYLSSILVLGFIAKSGIVPLHFWLPSAHTVAPTPASALLSGVMTSMGLYGLIRVNMIIEMDVYPTTYILLTLGLISILYGGLQAHIQRDGKKLLAYSTIAGNGFSLVLFSYYIYTQETVVLVTLILSILAHMAYKSTLFLDIGLAEQIYGFRYLHKLRGIAILSPRSVFGGSLAFLSLIGIPPTTGFASKIFSIIILISRIYDPVSMGVLLSVIIYIILSILIGMDYIKIYFGKPSEVIEKNIGTTSIVQDYAVIGLGLSNIFLALMIMVYGLFNEYLFIYILASPLLIIFTYLLITTLRRGV